MGWITRGATTLVELIGFGNVIVSALTGNPVTANDGSAVVIAGTWNADFIETLPALTTFVEKPQA